MPSLPEWIRREMAACGLAYAAIPAFDMADPGCGDTKPATEPFPPFSDAPEIQRRVALWAAEALGDQPDPRGHLRASSVDDRSPEVLLLEEAFKAGGRKGREVSGQAAFLGLAWFMVSREPRLRRIADELLRSLRDSGHLVAGLFGAASGLLEATTEQERREAVQSIADPSGDMVARATERPAVTLADSPWEAMDLDTKAVALLAEDPTRTKVGIARSLGLSPSYLSKRKQFPKFCTAWDASRSGRAEFQRGHRVKDRGQVDGKWAR